MALNYGTEIDGIVVPVTPDQWAYPFGDNRVARTPIADDIKVSTVFLGIEDAAGCWYETMVFAEHYPDIDQEWVDRYATRAEAEAGHEAMVAAVEAWVRAKLTGKGA